MYSVDYCAPFVVGRTPKDKNNGAFKQLHAVTDRYYCNRKLSEVGIEGKCQHAAVFTPEEENQLWTAGVLGIRSPASLQNCSAGIGDFASVNYVHVHVPTC